MNMDERPGNIPPKSAIHLASGSTVTSVITSHGGVRNIYILAVPFTASDTGWYRYNPETMKMDRYPVEPNQEWRRIPLPAGATQPRVSTCPTSR
jgi:hypothetical protein